MTCDTCLFVFNTYRCYECKHYPKNITKPQNPIRYSPIDGAKIVIIPKEP